MPAFFELTNIGKTYDLHNVKQAPAIQIPRLNIPLGGIIAIVGGSGSGKTTLLNMLGGLEKPDWADREDTSLLLKLNDELVPRELLSGTKPSHSSAIANGFPHSRVSYIFQQGYLLSQASIAINLAMTRRAAGLRADKAALSELLLMAKLHDDASPEIGQKKLTDRAVTLSGGQQQRINIARALGRDPAIIYADELTSSLDPIKAAAVLEELRSWIWSTAGSVDQDRRTLSRTMIWVTHDYHLASRFADAVIVLSDGALAKGCDRPIEFASLSSSTSAEELKSWVNTGEVKLSPTDLTEMQAWSMLEDNVTHVGGINIEDKSNVVAGEPLSRASAALGNMRSGIALSLMEAFQEKPRARRAWQNVLQKLFMPILGFSYWARALQLGAVLALLMIITYGQREVIGYFDQQLDDPTLRHVIVQQNTRELQRSVIDDDSLAEISKSLAASGSTERLAFGRFTESVDAYPKGSDDINTGFIAEIAIGILDAGEPVYEEMSVRSISPTNPDCAGAQLSSSRELIPYADELAVIVTKKYLDDAQRMFGVDLCQSPYLDLWDAGAPRTFRIVGFVDSLPADGYDNFDAIMQTNVWRSWVSLVGKNQISTFSRAAVYFTQSNHSEVMAELNSRSFAFDQEIVSKFERLINTAAQLRNTFLVITWLSLAVATTVAAGLIWGYLAQNAKSIAVLRAHDAWLWPLVAAIPFQILLTFGYGLVYVAISVGIWNLLVSRSTIKDSITTLTGGSWEPNGLQWADVSATLPWLMASFVVMILVGWCCLFIWRVTHRELAHELRQAY